MLISQLYIYSLLEMANNSTNNGNHEVILCVSNDASKKFDDLGTDDGVCHFCKK